MLKKYMQHFVQELHAGNKLASLTRHELEQAPGVSDGQGSLACCHPWSHKSQTQLSD